MRAELALTILLAGALVFESRKPETREPYHGAGNQLLMPPITFPDATAASAAEAGGDAGKGEVLFMQTCTPCHGQSARGMPHMGVNLRQSKFIAQANDLKLIAFLKRGRLPTDTGNLTGLMMPARGGNLTLEDDALADIVAFLRQVQKQG